MRSTLVRLVLVLGATLVAGGMLASPARATDAND
jgi:hypothetical protein